MGRARKQAGSDEGPSAPMWLVSFSDCMTNLVVFFVLLVTFSSFDKDVSGTFSQAARGIRWAFSVPFFLREQDKSAFLPANQIWATEQPDQGSEKPTLATEGKGLLSEGTEPADFRSRKVFIISADRIFLGKGVAISPQGRNIMAIMASFLKKVPGRIVISENGPQSAGRLSAEDASSQYLGLPRAWAVVQYLTTEQNLDKKRFSISAATTLPQESFEFEKDKPVQKLTEPQRTLEIVLLERSIYN